MTDGNPLMLESPCVVDPDAVVTWTSTPNGRGDPRVAMNNFSNHFSVEFSCASK